MIQHNLRLTRAWVPLVAICAVVLGACSSGGAPSGNPSGSGTPAQDYAAHTLNLASSDFPSSWKTIPNTGGSNPVRSGLDACVVQQQGPTPAAVATSKNFLDTASGQEVGSQVQVFDGDGQAAHSATIAGTASVSSCLGPVVKGTLAKNLTSRETLTNVSASVVPPQSSGPHAFGQRVIATISYLGKDGKPASEDVYVDVLGFSHGPVVVEAEFENPGSAPSASLESSTMTTLLKRAQAS